MKKILSLLVMIFSLLMFSNVNGQLMITELTDPQNSSDAGRYVEIYNSGSEDIDLSTGYALQRWTNAATDPQSAVSLTGTIAAGGFYIVCNDADKFLATYGMDASQDIGTGGAADSNGDDNIALLGPDGSIIDMFGVAGEDGSGTGHEFEDGRAERVCGTSASSTWIEADWNIDNDSGGGDGNQYAPEGFDPFIWDCGVQEVLGCMDATACNYNADANADDSSCTYAQENFDCDGNCTADVDCAGTCAGSATVDNCGTCDDDASNDCTVDCSSLSATASSSDVNCDGLGSASVSTSCGSSSETLTVSAESYGYSNPYVMELSIDGIGWIDLLG
ncbi:MAG: hypothetical protein CMD26_01265, partial [Flavobacteriales bacterium]|nr:hypothetical protein [Flavobacteriales bacterium]